MRNGMRMKLEINDLRDAFLEALERQHRSVGESMSETEIPSVGEEWGTGGSRTGGVVLAAAESATGAGRCGKVHYGADGADGGEGSSRTPSSSSRVREPGMILAA